MHISVELLKYNCEAIGLILHNVGYDRFVDVKLYKSIKPVKVDLGITDEDDNVTYKELESLLGYGINAILYKIIANGEQEIDMTTFGRCEEDIDDYPNVPDEVIDACEEILSKVHNVKF